MGNVFFPPDVKSLQQGLNEAERKASTYQKRYTRMQVCCGLSCIFNTTVADDLGMQGTRALSSHDIDLVLPEYTGFSTKMANMKSLIQCKPDISRSRISPNWIYRGRMLDPMFWRPKARYFSRNRGNSLDPIRGRQFFAKSAHRDSLRSRFAGDNFSRNQLKPTCQCGLEHMLCDGQPR